MRITLYGANGFSGQLIGEALVASGFRPQLAVRQRASLEGLNAPWCQGLSRVVLDSESNRDRERLRSSTDILIQCAGPYSRLPAEWYSELAQWPGSIIDLCGEAHWLRHLQAHYGVALLDHGGLWLPACAFESVLALWLVEACLHRLAKETGPWDVQTFYSHGQPRLSPGTKATARLSKGMPMDIWEDGQWKVPTPKEIRFARPWPKKEQTVENPNSMAQALLTPLPEIPLLALNASIRSCASYLLMEEADAAFFQASQSSSSVTLASPPKRKRDFGPSLEERRRHTFSVSARVESPLTQKSMMAVLRGSDPYGVTAYLVTETVYALIDRIHQGTRPNGIHSATDILGFQMGLPKCLDQQKMALIWNDEIQRLG